MRATLKEFKGKTVRLYTISGVESYLGTIHDVNRECVILRDALHGELMYIAIGQVESFHEARVGK